MTHTPDEFSSSWLSELLLYHAALGRGYHAQIPVARGLVFSSALPTQALRNLGEAEARVRETYAEHQRSIRQELDTLKEKPKELQAVGGDRVRVRELQALASRNCYITRTEDGATKSTILDLLQQSHYGSMTFLDPAGARLAVALSVPQKLASDLGWYTLTEGSSEEALLRSSDNGTLMLSLVGQSLRFNYFCRCNDKMLVNLEDRVKNSVSGQVGIGHVITLSGEPPAQSTVSVATLESLMRRVYMLGDRDVDARIQVKFASASLGGWFSFLRWGLKDLIDNKKEPSDWQLQLSKTSPTSPENAVLFGARAAMTWAFIDAATVKPHGDLPRVIELEEKYLEAAKVFARHLYLKSSGHESYAVKLANLEPRTGRVNYITPAKLQAARRALEKAILANPDNRISRHQTRSIPLVTLNLVDELVRRGEIIELVGTGECQMGKTTRAYILPSIHHRIDDREAADEFAEACERYTEDTAAVRLEDASKIYEELQVRAEEFHNEHMLPAVPLTCMTREQRRVLPKILEIFSDRVFMRAEEPAELLGEGSPLDVRGMNLWMRDRPDGEPFRKDWRIAAKLQLTHFCETSSANDEVEDT